MKNIILNIICAWPSVLVTAQQNPRGEKGSLSSGLNDNSVESVYREFHAETILAMIFVGLLVYLIISLVRYFLDHRLKNKLVDKGAAEHLAALIQDSNSTDKNDQAIRLAILFCGIGIGLMITYFTLPLHIHSLAIMSFSIGLSYMAHFFYLKNRKK